MGKQKDDSVRKPSLLIVKMWGVLRNEERLPETWDVLRDRTMSSDSANPPDSVQVESDCEEIPRHSAGSRKLENSTKKKESTETPPNRVRHKSGGE